MQSVSTAPRSSLTRLIVRTIAGVLMLGGAALALWALTLPWRHYEPPPGLGLPQDPRTFIPAQDFAQSLPIVPNAIYVCLPAVLGLFGLIELLRPRVLRRTRVIAGLMLALLGLGMSALLSWPSLLNDTAYRLVLDAGVSVSYLGYACALVGSLLSIPSGE